MPPLSASTRHCWQAWRSGDCAPVHSMLAPSAHSVSPIFGEKKASRQEWEEMVHDVFKARLQWQCDSDLHPTRLTLRGLRSNGLTPPAPAGQARLQACQVASRPAFNAEVWLPDLASARFLRGLDCAAVHLRRCGR